MSQEKLKMGSYIDVKEAIYRCNERILVFNTRLPCKKKAFELYILEVESK